MTTRNSSLRKFAATLLTLSLAAQSTLSTVVASEPAPINRVQDVELSDGGVLTTRVVNLQGQPVADEKVAVVYQGKQIATAVSDKDGYVAVKGLRPGAHTLATSTFTASCRFWTKNSAPPAAVQVPALVSDMDVVRGQFGAFNLPMLVVVGATVASGIIAIDANDEASKARDEAAALRKRVEVLESASP
ncbi:MAG: hypothetical protein R3C20_18340 [Planctomycetaceae bacterium]